MSTAFALAARVTSLLPRPAIESVRFASSFHGDAFDAQAALAEAGSHLRSGRHERALERVVVLLLRGAPVSGELLSLVDTFLPADRASLWVDAVSYASIGVRARGLACVAGALRSGSADVESAASLKWTLRKLGVAAPVLPLINAELAS